MSSKKSLAHVQNRIQAAAREAGRDPETVRLLAVGKSKPAEQLRRLAEAGQKDFGENYVQEALDKMSALADLEDLIWHFIGPLQSNKTRAVAEAFHWVHSVDRLKIAKRLSAQRPEQLPPLNICIQVNISEEAQKAGIAPSETAALADACAKLPRIRLRGLMCLPAPAPDAESQRLAFRQLRRLQEALIRQGHTLDTLSMGMSADLEAAILEGSTLVRIGSALFGPRD
jgi:PLP dependent protein